MKILTALVTLALLAPSCSGPDVDIGNGKDGVQGKTTGAAGSSAATGATGGETSTTTGSDGTGVTTGSSGVGTGMTSGSSAVTTGMTTGSSAVTTGMTSGAGGPGTGTGTGGSGGSTGIGGGPASAIVIRYGDIPVSNPPSGTSSTTGGTPIDPDTPYLFVGNGPPTCSDPSAGPPCGFWRVTVGIPRALFQPGVLSLSDSRLISVHSVRGPDRGGGDCFGGGGSFIDGTLELSNITSSSASVRLAATSKFDFDADGSYTAVVCQ